MPDKKIDWSRFGLSSDRQQEPDERTRLKDLDTEEGFYHGEEELFDTEKANKPWWLSRLLLSERTLFGAWDGVFTSCLVNLLGVIVFLRSGWVVSQAGIASASLITLVTVIIVATSVLSAVGIISRINVESGGIYFLISHVLGSRVGGAVGLVYCFGQAVGISLCISGFGESMAELLHLEGVWAERGLGAGALLLLAVINIAGVKWVVKIQVILLILLLLAVLDFLFGSFMKHDEEGVTGWSMSTFRSNLWAQYSPGHTWFTAFGVFFPTVTGCMAGINMSGDLRHPATNIPIGSLSALAFSLCVYLVFVLVLGGTVSRKVLLKDNMITEKLSASGVLLLVGLYTSTLASTLASLYGTPRVLQSIASEQVVPLMTPLQMGKGPNKLPILSLLATVLVNVTFLLIGRINTLAPIVTMPFLVTYAAMDYAYFVLCMSTEGLPASGGVIAGKGQSVSASTSLCAKSAPGPNDLDRLFPERVTRKKLLTRSNASSDSSSAASPAGSPKADDDEISNADSSSVREGSLIGAGAEGEDELLTAPIKDKVVSTTDWMTAMCNKWISLLGALLKICLMFAVQWMYGLITISCMLILYYYIGRSAPGAPPGVASNFNFFRWVQRKVLVCFGLASSDYDEVIVAPLHPGVDVTASQLTQENKDFANRSKFHHSKPGERLAGIQ